jgi:hypothetical protein
MENSSNIQEKVEEGMKLAARLPDIMPDQASEEISPVYEDIQRTLRIPLVNLILRTLANYPDYFTYMWNGLRLFAQKRSRKRPTTSVERPFWKSCRRLPV